jgi:acetyl esterase/lipase
VICAGHDLLRDDARAYAARMDADGADVTHVAIGSLAAGRPLAWLVWLVRWLWW